MKEKPSISIIIPTKNRGKYLRFTLDTMTQQDYGNLHVIISDDGSIDNTKELVEKYARKDRRITYISPGSAVGMSANFEFALDQVKSGYVMAVGGDDGLSSDRSVSEMAEAVQQSNCGLVTWNPPLYIYEGGRAGIYGQLVVPTECKDTMVSSLDLLESLSVNLNYIDNPHTPMIYGKSIVSTKLVDQVRSRSKNKKFYQCSTPDGYSGIVLAGELKEYPFLKKSFTIMGAAPDSQGYIYTDGKKESVKQANEFYRSAENQTMHRDLASQPYSPLISLMTADFLLSAKDLNGWPGNFPDINHQILIDKCINELLDSNFHFSRIPREIRIIHNIAKKHRLESYFLKKIEQRRNLRKRLYGPAFSRSRCYFSAQYHSLNNICDGANFYMKHRKKLFLGFKPVEFFHAIFNSILYWSRNVSIGTRLSRYL